MLKEKEAKTILNRLTRPDTWFGLTYTMNLYRGCQFQCIYCDSRSDIYNHEDFSDVEAKTNGIELLRKELSSKRNKGTIGFGSMHDPYMPIEKKLELTREGIKAIADFRFPMHLITRGDLITRDIDVLQRASRVYCAVSFTITTCDEELARKIEPGAPIPSRRLEAMKILSENGIYVGVTFMPLLPFIEDTIENIREVVTLSARYGAKYIIPAFGMTLRDGNREYFYQKLDESFPGMRKKYEEKFGNKYSCEPENVETLYTYFYNLCDELGIDTKMKFYEEEHIEQYDLFGK